jgi:hypothetical protein
VLGGHNKSHFREKENLKNESPSNNEPEPLKNGPDEAIRNEIEFEESEEMDLTEEELEEMELMAEIGEFLDEITGERYEDLKQSECKQCIEARLAVRN